jgi:hypothetical protein
VALKIGVGVFVGGRGSFLIGVGVMICGVRVRRERSEPCVGDGLGDGMTATAVAGDAVWSADSVDDAIQLNPNPNSKIPAPAVRKIPRMTKGKSESLLFWRRMKKVVSYQ